LWSKPKLLTAILVEEARMRLTPRLLAITLFLGAALLCLPARAADAPSDFVQQVRKDAEWFASFPSRVVGTEGHEQAQRELLAKLREAAGGARVMEHRFRVVVPRVLRAELTVGEGPLRGTYRIYPVWPAGVRLNTTPAEGIEGRLLYVGEGEPGKLPGHVPARTLRGQIAVLEMSARARWMEVHNAGARAILLLGSPDLTYHDMATHLAAAPIYVPRFYIPDGELADALRSQKATGQPAGRVVCEARWEEVTATNYYVLVRPASAPEVPKKDPDAKSWQQVERNKTLHRRQAFVVGVPYDSMSVVPELAPGADAAVDVAFALNLLRRCVGEAPERPVLFAFVDAYAMDQLGVREMLGAFAVVPKDRKEHVAADVEELDDYREHAALAEEIATLYRPTEERTDPAELVLLKRQALDRLHEARYRPLRRHVKDEVAREIVRIEGETSPARLRMSRTARRMRDLRSEWEKHEAAVRELRARMGAGPSRKGPEGPLESPARAEEDSARGALSPAGLTSPQLEARIDELEDEWKAHKAEARELRDCIREGLSQEQVKRSQIEERLRKLEGLEDAWAQVRVELLQALRARRHRLWVRSEELSDDHAVCYGAKRRLHTEAALREIDSFTRPDGEALTEEDFERIVAARRVLRELALSEGKRITAEQVAEEEPNQEALDAFDLQSGHPLTLEGYQEVRAAHRTFEAFGLTGKKTPGETILALRSSRKAVALWDRAYARIAGQLDGLEEIVARHEERDRWRRELLDALGLAGHTDRPLGFVFGLDLSGEGATVGPCYADRYRGIDERDNARSFHDWLNERRKTLGPWFWPADLRTAVSLSIMAGREAGCSQLAAVANFSSPAESFATAGVTWSVLDALRTRVDTPADTADALDWGHLGPQIRATLFLLEQLVNAPDFAPSTTADAQWSRVYGTIVDQSPGEPVPRVPMDGYLAELVPGSVGAEGGSVGSGAIAGVRGGKFTFTRIDGRFRFDLLPVRSAGRATGHFIQAYRLAEDGRLERAVDMLKSGRGVTLDTDTRGRNPGKLRAVVFSCVEWTGVDFFDPRRLAGLGKLSFMDARTGSKPQRMNLTRAGEHTACQLEPDVRWQVTLRHGLAKNHRVALLNVKDPDDEETRGASTRKLMAGFELDDLLPMHRVHQSARDFYRLDTIRLRNYRAAGISSKHIDELQKRTEQKLKEADAALEADDGAQYAEATSAALSNEVRVYQAVRKTANDVIQGAIFLLLMLVPFSFVMERLLFASPNIYKQIGAVVGTFSVMTAVLWGFHPAFRITSQPLMILMAFGALGMSLMVMSVVFSKFETQLEELKSGRAEGSGARTSRLGVAYTALRLGIANMRKRKLRTALTGITVVLITFALLCFMSASSYVGKKGRRRGDDALYPGVLIALPKSRTMPVKSMAVLRNIAREESALVVPRLWWVSPSNEWRLHVRVPGRREQVSLIAALGLAPEEDRLTGVGRWCPDWGTFARGDACYLAPDTAERLKIEPGDDVVIAGRRLTLAGTFDPEKLDKGFVRLDGTSMRPYDFTEADDDELRRMADKTVEEATTEMVTGVALEPEQLPHVPSNMMAIIPADLAQAAGGTLRSVGIRVEDHKTAQKLAVALSKHLAFPVYHSIPGGEVRVLASIMPWPQPPKSLFIPLAIAGLIILNTMLSSIAERKREIYIYTSLGLAPLHVGFLFLAEAVTYGLMGSIFGYIVGQGVAKLLGALGLMSGVTLNYSGVQAIMTMLMVLGVVIVSSLVPAYLAGKLATPSNEMTWKVPRPVDDVIRDKLPFTATDRTAGGVLEFLYEYMDAHREGSIGTFGADHLKRFCHRHEGREVLGLDATIWLAPYDLGVRQDARILIHSTADPGVYEIDIELRRRSGQVTSWWKLNRVLLADIRRQLLGWRKLKIDRMLEYITRAAERPELAEPDPI